jgi:uncharacterized protein YdiU (UPF0061 family)
MMADHKLDFHLTFRHLTRFRPGLLSSLDPFIDTLLRFTSTGEVPQRGGVSEQWKSWLEKFAARIEREKEEWDGTTSEAVDWQVRRETVARLANPRFVLRQWVLEEAIAKVEADAQSGRRFLAKVMQVRLRYMSVICEMIKKSRHFLLTQMACNPYEAWGGEGDTGADEGLNAETKEERRLCGIGDQRMLGLQCSCSS